MQAFSKGPVVASVHITHMVQDALPHAQDELAVTLAHCSHPVEMVADGLNPALQHRVLFAGSTELLLDAWDMDTQKLCQAMLATFPAALS